MSFEAVSELKCSQVIVLGRTFTCIVVDESKILFPHLFGLFNRFISKFERKFFSFFFRSCLGNGKLMSSHWEVRSTILVSFFNMASLTNIMTIFTGYIVFPAKFDLFLDLRKYFSFIYNPDIFLKQRILEFFCLGVVWWS